jgi:hypothetical protein
VSRSCPICECDEIEAGDVDRRLLDEYWPEDERADYLGLKRELEAEFDFDLSVTTLKQHLNTHLKYTWGEGQ